MLALAHFAAIVAALWHDQASADTLRPGITARRAFDGFARTQSDFDVSVVNVFARKHLCWAKSCCAARYGPGGNPACWDEIYSHEVCCAPYEGVPWPTAKRFALQVAHHLWKRSMWFNLFEPAICHQGGGDTSLPMLPAHRPANSTPSPTLSGLSVVVMTQLREFGPNGRVAGITGTWARRLHGGSVALAMEDVEVPDHLLPATARVLRIPCPTYWLLDCDTYTASIYLGHYGLRRALQLRPRARWVMVCDDDLYVNTYALAQYLRGLDAEATLCVGAHERSDRPLLSYWSGIICSNSAARLLYRHLEGATRWTVERSLGYSAGDFIISKCLWDLGIPMVDLPGFFFAWSDRASAGGVPRMAATIHGVKSRGEFEELDGLLLRAQKKT